MVAVENLLFGFPRSLWTLLCASTAPAASTGHVSSAKRPTWWVGTDLVTCELGPLVARNSRPGTDVVPTQLGLDRAADHGRAREIIFFTSRHPLAPCCANCDSAGIVRTEENA